MKKIALISVHNDPNYGSALQAYALAYAIKREGYECEYIDYKPIVGHRSVLWLKTIIKRILCVFGLPKRTNGEYSYWNTQEFKHQRQLFSDFHNRLIPFSLKPYNPSNIMEANTDYDCFVVGSDQTWSPYVTNLNQTINFLSFVEKGKIKGAYAPSIGTCHLTEEYIAKLQSKIKDFDSLSCREKQNAELLTERLGREVEYVLDPTLLLNKEEWLKIAEPIDMPEKYVLCYILGTKQCISDFAELLGNKASMPVYYIVTRPEYLAKSNALKDVTPEQFITLVNMASIVVTDSFHGSLFSINFKRQFYSFTKREACECEVDNDRIGDFLGILNLSNRLKKDSDFTITQDIDYNMVDGTIMTIKRKSIIYLKRMLQKRES